MLKIRLQRVGRRNSPAFRVVVTESTRGPKSGNNVELLGTYNPHADASQLNAERIKYWVGRGAQVSDTVHNILVNEKVIEGKKINVLPKKVPIQKESAEGEQASAPTAEGEAESAPAEGTAETPGEAPAEEAVVEAVPQEEAPAEEPAPTEEEKKKETPST